MCAIILVIYVVISNMYFQVVKRQDFIVYILKYCSSINHVGRCLFHILISGGSKRVAIRPSFVEHFKQKKTFVVNLACSIPI